MSKDPNCLCDGVRNISPFEVRVRDVDVVRTKIQIRQIKYVEVSAMPFFQLELDHVNIGFRGNQKDSQSRSHIIRRFIPIHISLLIYVYVFNINL